VMRLGKKEIDVGRNRIGAMLQPLSWRYSCRGFS